MENKYYTPQIEEFHVGFEYEVFVDKNFEYWDHTKGAWVKNEFYGGGVDQDGGNSEIEALRYLLEDNKADLMVRVKYLDQEDIESLGWEKQEADYKGTPVFKLKDKGWHMDVDKDNKCYIHNGEAYEQNQCVFYGTIKNKSELKRVMGMIKLDVT